MFNFDEISSRITISEILRLLGYEPGEDRMACPIHHGSNPTAFNFNDSGFICHSCGAKGGLLDLTVSLSGKSRREALAWLAEKTGVKFEAQSGGVRGVADSLISLPPYSVAFKIARRINLQTDYDAVDQRIKGLTKELNFTLSEYGFVDPAIEYEIETYEEEKLKIWQEAKVQGIRLKDKPWYPLNEDQAMFCLRMKIHFMIKDRRKPKKDDTGEWFMWDEDGELIG